MSLRTLKELTDRVLEQTGMGRQRINIAREWVNAAHQDVCEAYNWKELMKKGTITTVAPYSTGTVSTSGTTVTGVGTTFTSAMVGRKFAAGYGKPWFTIETFTDATHVEIDTSWPWTDLSGATYVIYEDVYSLASTVDKVIESLVYLYDDDGRQLCQLNEATFQAVRDFPESSGEPDYYAIIENDAAGNLQMQLGGCAPDQVYMVKFGYREKHIPMVKDGAEPQLRPTLMETVVTGALSRAYGMPEYAGTGMAQAEEAKFERQMGKKIARAIREGGRSIRPMTSSERGANRGQRHGWPFSLPVEAD